MLLPAAPTFLVAVGGMALILGRRVPASRWYEAVWLASSVGIAGWLFAGDPRSIAEPAGGAWSNDSFSVAGQWLALVSASVFGIGSFGVRGPADQTAFRLGSLSILTAGVMLSASANDLMALALSVEIVQLASWGLRSVDRWEHRERRTDAANHSAGASDQAGLWLGIASSSALWLGIALVASVTASTQFDQIRLVLADAYAAGHGRVAIGSGSRLGLVGIGLIVAGLGSRIGLVPWQMNLRESSQGVRHWTAGCVVVIGQLAGILALARLCGEVWVGYRKEMLVLLVVTSGLTCAVSAGLSVAGLLSGQGRLHRWAVSLAMLQGAWLTIGLMGVTADLATPEHSLAGAGSQPGSLALLVFAAGASQIGLAGAFLMLSYLSPADRDVEFVDELLGLGRMRPLPAAILLIVLASLAGQPPLWGFWSYWLQTVVGLNVRGEGGREAAAPHAGLIVAVVAATFASLASLGVVVRIARAILLDPPISRPDAGGRRPALMAGCACAAALLLVGLFPSPLLRVLSTIRGQVTRSSADEPAGAPRGSATALR